MDKAVVVRNVAIVEKDDLKEREVNNMTKYSKEWWMQWIYCAGIRAVRTIAQTAVGVIGASAIISDVNWVVVASASALSGITSLLTSIAGLPEITESGAK